MPDWKRFLREALTLPEMKSHRDERIIAELADHLEDLYRDLRRRGATPEEAERRVKEWLGDPEQAARELMGAEPGQVRARLGRWTEEREEMLRRRGNPWTRAADLLGDLRTALRALSRRPLFSGVVILVLALGIGAASAIFALVDGILLSPLPFADADRLVVLSHGRPDRGEDDVGQCAAWHFTYEDENRVFQDLGMYTFTTAAVTGDREPEALRVLRLTNGVFGALAVRPVLGRLFTAQDDDPDGLPVVVLGHGYWLSHFGGDPSILGRTLDVDGITREVVGVAPSDIGTLGAEPALIYPLRFRRADLFVGNVGYDAVARLREGVTLEQALADMERMVPMAHEKFPGGPVVTAATGSRTVPHIRLLKDDLVGDAASLLWVLLAGVGVVLLIACANVANLLLVRAEGRSTEMAVRTAVGASRRRIGWEHLKESLLLGVLGGAAGLALAWMGLKALVALGPAQLPRLDAVSLDRGVFLFVAALSLVAGAFAGLLPVVNRRGEELAGALKDGGHGGSGGKRRHRIQSILAVSQMALAVVLLVGAGLLVRSGRALGRVDTGVRAPRDIMALGLNFASRVIPDREEAIAAQEAVARRLGEIAGVSSVAMATEIPMHSGGNINPLYVEGITDPSVAPPQTRRHKWVGAGYFETLGIRVLAGRTFTWQDVHDRIAGVLVSESLAREYWGSVEAAMGKHVSVRPDPVRWYEVIGVVADVREDGVDQDAPVMVYWPQVTLAFWQGSPADQVMFWRYAAYALRTDRIGTPGFLSDIQRAVWSVNPDLPLLSVGPLDGFMARSVARRSFTLALLTISAVVALILGSVGVYGVLSYAVSQRSREMGMRMAIGADPARLRIMVVRQGMTLAAAGTAVGLVLALGLTRLMTSLLYGVEPVDPLTFGLVAMGLMAVALVATWLPAHRASLVDPVTALREG